MKITIRFGIRTILVVTLAACACLAWWAFHAEQQKKTVDWIIANGGTVQYDYQWSSSRNRYYDGDPPGPEWLRELIGIHFLSSVKSVNLSGSNRLTDITPLSELKRVELLYLCGAQVTDLQPLLQLKQLECLSIWNTTVADPGVLSKLSHLTSLDVRDTKLTIQQIDGLQKSLPNCEIER